jgi:hypothetical protein
MGSLKETAAHPFARSVPSLRSRRATAYGRDNDDRAALPASFPSHDGTLPRSGGAWALDSYAEIAPKRTETHLVRGTPHLHYWRSNTSEPRTPREVDIVVCGVLSVDGSVFVKATNLTSHLVKSHQYGQKRYPLRWIGSALVRVVGPPIAGASELLVVRLASSSPPASSRSLFNSERC